MAITGHELEPGVRVLDGIFRASALRTVMDFPSDTDTSEGDPPNFQQLRAMNVLMHCTKKSTQVDYSTFGCLSCTAQSKADLQDALHHTADILSSLLDAYDSHFCQPSVDVFPLTEEPLTLLGSNRQDLVTLQLQDPTLKLIDQYLSAGSKKSAFHDLSSHKLVFKTWYDDGLVWKDVLCIQTTFLTTLATFASSFPTTKTCSPGYCAHIITRHSGCIEYEIIPTMPSLDISIGQGWEGNETLGCKMSRMPQA